MTHRMSQRVKRPNNQLLRCDDGSAPATKRRKCRPVAVEEEEAAADAAAAAAAAQQAQQQQQQAALWQPRPLNDLKISSIYNRYVMYLSLPFKQSSDDQYLFVNILVLTILLKV